MPSKNLNKEILFLFPNNSKIITTPKIYIEITGSHSLAMVLNQCIFWSNKSKTNDGWFFKSYEDWSEELNISERTLKRRFDKLEELGLIATKVKQAHGKTLKHFFVFIDKIIDSLSAKLGIQNPKSQNIKNKIGNSASDNLADPTIYIDTDEYKQTSSDEVSQSFFSENQKQELLSLRTPSDQRTEQEFLENCQHHLEIQNNDKNKHQRLFGLKKILTSLKSTKEIFSAVDFQKRESQKIKRIQESEKMRELREEAQQKAWESKSKIKNINTPIKKPYKKLSDMLEELKYANKR